MNSSISRRDFLNCGVVTALAGPGASSGAETEPGQGTKPQTVRDRLWAWAHEAGVYNGAWGLPGTSRITPVEGAHYLGVPNIIFIRYEGRPMPPFEQYAVPFKSMKRVSWSITGAGGATSEEERMHVLGLTSTLPNLTGVFMDDFFQFTGDVLPQWLAENRVDFPVSLTVTLSSPTAPTELEVTQSDWSTGDYRSGDLAIDLSNDGVRWREVATAKVPNQAGGRVTVQLPGVETSFLRIRILNTQDTAGALSCGLRRLRLFASTREIPLGQAKILASSTFPNHDAQNLLAEDQDRGERTPAALSPRQLRQVREQLTRNGRRLDLGVTLYTGQLVARATPHLELCDVISLWTWESKDLVDLEASFAKLKRMVPSKRLLLGCYMWDFGAGKPMPLDRMKRQCALGLDWLRTGQIEGLILLATNLCDLGLETVEWTRDWVAEVGDHRL